MDVSTNNSKLSTVSNFITHLIPTLKQLCNPSFLLSSATCGCAYACCYLFQRIRNNYHHNNGLRRFVITMTRSQLREHHSLSPTARILIALKNRVYDVSASDDFKFAGDYDNLTGRDITKMTLRFGTDFTNEWEQMLRNNYIVYAELIEGDESDLDKSEGVLITDRDEINEQLDEVRNFFFEAEEGTDHRPDGGGDSLN